nr:cysteine-rich PDZ-binding protein isoform X7 [Anser cygnoides]
MSSAELAFLGCLWMHKLQWRLDPLVPDYQSVIPALDKDRAALLHTFLTSILDHGTFSQQNKETMSNPMCSSWIFHGILRQPTAKLNIELGDWQILFPAKD